MDIDILASSSAGNAYRVSDGKTGLLLDCGLAWREIQRILHFQTSALAGILLTHEHGDHAKAARDAAKAGLDIFSGQGTFDALALSGHRCHPAKARHQFRLGTFTVLPFDTVHDAAEPLGFLLASGDEKLVYLTDTAYSRYMFPGLTHILVEANYSDDILRERVESGEVDVAMKSRLLRSHMSLQTCKEFLLANDLSQVEAIYLIHLSNGNSDAARFKREVQAATGKPVYVAG
ncbi:MBL fold metallo-hydrolase [Anaeroselena agilis]|uniref:MBL fold metallo-hydrolase n=1 Tax=Anaeroselena agilis TaxID=3063788 RepID=A0ABU3NXJ8_9FIRM|nr:MBL fold metallo-hydrolase [Selenomonadales bacterium 4137-cl]